MNKAKSKVIKAKSKKVLNVLITYCILIIVAFIFFFPCLWLILASFSKSGSIYSFDGFFPSEYSVEAFKVLFTDTVMYNYPRWFLNTLFIAGMSCILGTLLTILTAYCMSRFRFKSRKAMMKTTLVLGMFPSFMGTIAVYLLMTQFNLINQHWGLILIYSAQAPMGYMVQKGFFDTVPYSIDEAARIDGASNFTVFVKFILPMSKPILVYTALTAFTWPWSDFILPKMLLQDKNLYTVAVGLMSLGETEFARFAAGSIIIAIPIIVLYFCLVKYMINKRSISVDLGESLSSDERLSVRIFSSVFKWNSKIGTFNILNWW
ncbi:MAG: sugar ABC transporter permease [Candidatus Coproplasma sp.]